MGESWASSCDEIAWITIFHPSYQNYFLGLTILVYWSTPKYILGDSFSRTFYDWILPNLLLISHFLRGASSHLGEQSITCGTWMGSESRAYLRWLFMGVRCWVGRGQHAAEGDGEEEHQDNELGRLHLTSKIDILSINSNYFQLWSYWTSFQKWNTNGSFSSYINICLVLFIELITALHSKDHFTSPFRRGRGLSPACFPQTAVL